MIIGCGLPLLLLFLAPVIGLSSNITIFIFIIAMFASHLLMAKHHGHDANKLNQHKS